MDKFVQITPLNGDSSWIVNTSQIIAVEKTNINTNINTTIFHLVGDIKVESSFKYETAIALLEVPYAF